MYRFFRINWLNTKSSSFQEINFIKSTYACFTNLCARVTFCFVWPIKCRIESRTRGILSRTANIIQALITLHANRFIRCETARIITTRALTRTALFAWLKLAFVCVLTSINAACFFTICAVATVALFAFFDYTVATQWSTELWWVKIEKKKLASL